MSKTCLRKKTEFRQTPVQLCEHTCAESVNSRCSQTHKAQERDAFATRSGLNEHEMQSLDKRQSWQQDNLGSFEISLRTKSVRLLAGQLEGTRSNEQCAAFSNSEQSSSESAEINIPAQNEFKLIAHCGNNREHELMRQHEHSRAGIVQGWPTAQNSSNYDLKCTEQRKNWMYTA